jgi:hypothetical protein
LEEEALLNLEFKGAARLNEVIELRNREERQRRTRLDLDFRKKNQEL